MERTEPISDQRLERLHVHLSEPWGDVAAGYKGVGRILDDEGGSGPAVSARNDNSGDSGDIAGSVQRA